MNAIRSYLVNRQMRAEAAHLARWGCTRRPLSNREQRIVERLVASRA